MFSIINQNNKTFIVNINKKIFLTQYFLNIKNINVSKKTFTFLYLVKVLTKMGLIAPLNKKFGY